MDALDLAIANVQSSIPDVSAFVTSLQVRALIDTSLSDYYDKQAIDGKLADYYTKTEIGNNFFTKQQTNSLLNTTLQNYYNKAETVAKIDSRLTSYYTKSQVYSKTETDTKLTDYYTKTETYNKQEVDNLITQPVDLSLYAKKTDASQTITAAKFIAPVFQSFANANNALYFEDKNAYFTFPLQVTDSSKSGLKTYSYLDGGNTGYGYLGIWRDKYYPHLSMSKTLTTFNKPGSFSDVVTFNNDVTFNDVVVLTSTIALGTKVIDTVVRSNDDITPSDTNIPSTLWAQNKFNTKVDNGTVYYKVDLNNLLQLENLSSIVLTYDHSESISFNRSELFFFSQTTSDTIGQKLYYNSKRRNFSYNGKILIISPSATFRTIEIRSNTGNINPGNWYTFLPNENFKTIKITQHEREFSPCYYQLPVIIGMPSYIPSVGAITNSMSTSVFSLQLSFTYTLDDIPHVETWPYSYQDITTEIATMSGNNILNQSKTRGGFYFIFNGKTVDQNLWNYQTTVRWLFLGEQQSYSYSSNNGSVFYIPFRHNRYQIWYGQFQFKAENTNAPSFYRHSFQVNIPSASRISGGPDMDTFVIEIGDFTMACDMFLGTLTNLN